jgi:adenylate kinase
MRLFSTSTKAAAKGSFKIMFLGAPGAGKGTYASRIAPMLNIPTISTGDLVRHEIKTGTHLGDQIKASSMSSFACGCGGWGSFCT